MTRRCVRVTEQRMAPAIELLSAGTHLSEVVRRTQLPLTTVSRYAKKVGVAMPLAPSTKKHGTCIVCGALFTRARRRGRLRRTCSLACHIKTRDYTGVSNPNYRGGQKHICDYCHREFIGKRPRNGRYVRKYCSTRCSGLGTTAYMLKLGLPTIDRRDLNEPEIVRAAEKMGGVWVKAPPLDGWCWHRLHGWRPVEIKQPSRRGRANEFQPSQLKFFEYCKAIGAPFLVWYSVDDVIRDLS